MKSLNLYPFQFKTRKSNTRQMEYWLSSNIGKVNTDWSVMYYFAETEYCFRYENHAAMFALRWL